jgi:MFS family permease
MPVANSLIAVWFPPEKRTSMAGILISMQGVGIFLGHRIGESFKGLWQTAFILTGIPILFLGFL